MNCPEQDTALSTAIPTPEKVDEASAGSLFAGDTGTLPLETRRVLALLLNGPYLDSRRHPYLWPVLLRDEMAVRSRLADIFLDLVTDSEMEVAFIRQADVNGLDVPILLRRMQLTLIDSALLLNLRQRLSQALTEGERAVVSLDELFEYLRMFERAVNTDHSGFEKRIHAAIEKVKKHNILHTIRGANDRFEVSPALKLLLSAEVVQSFIDLYRRMAAGETPDADDVSAWDDVSKSDAEDDE